MTWTYRIVRRNYKTGDTYAIHEWYVPRDGDEDGIGSITDDPVGVEGDSVGDLVENLSCMLRAVNRPVLRYEDFGADGE